MTIDVNTVENFDVDQILEDRGLGRNNAAWLYAAAKFKEYADKYVPFKQGTLKNTAICAATNDGAYVKYTQEYAHYQYYGKTMGPNVLTKNGWRSFAPKGGKRYTGGSLVYSHLGRGDHWDRRMLNARKKDLMDDIALYVGGTAK